MGDLGLFSSAMLEIGGQRDAIVDNFVSLLGVHIKATFSIAL
jgi:hypothetical protein